jgi:DNA integrity scanning protein DisA with diadenylate cyclase activity
METIITPLQQELIVAAAAMAAKKEIDHLLYVGDLPLPEDLVKARSTARKKLVQAVSSEAQRQVIEAMGIPTIALPVFDMARAERFKIALVGGLAKNTFKNGQVVLGILGRRPASYPDSLFIVTIGSDAESIDTGFQVVGTSRVPSTILETLIDLAMSIAVDGWEGHPLGTLMVVGDTAAVMEKSKQLTLNPFQGYSEAEKNVLNPEVRHAIKNFAVLDGAFVIREDGVVLAAGRYVKFDENKEFKVPLGLGARHVAAAGISQDTEALAIVVSETTGEVRVFQKGRCVMQMSPQQRHQRGSTDQGPPPAKPIPPAKQEPPSEGRETAEPKEPKDAKREGKEKDKVEKEKADKGEARAK